MGEEEKNKPTMSGPARYRIRVSGRIEPAWAARLGAMEITESTGSDGEVVTMLVGRVDDQAAFSGVVNALYELHLPMLSTEWIGDEDCEPGRDEAQ